MEVQRKIAPDIQKGICRKSKARYIGRKYKGETGDKYAVTQPHDNAMVISEKYKELNEKNMHNLNPQLNSTDV